MRRYAYLAVMGLALACGTSSSSPPAGGGGTSQTTSTGKSSSSSSSSGSQSSSQALASITSVTSGGGGMGGGSCDPAPDPNKLLTLKDTLFGDPAPTSLCKYQGDVLLVMNIAEL